MYKVKREEKKQTKKIKKRRKVNKKEIGMETEKRYVAVNKHKKSNRWLANRPDYCALRDPPIPFVFLTISLFIYFPSISKTLSLRLFLLLRLCSRLSQSLEPLFVLFSL